MQGAQQINHLRLDQHIERAGRLVEHNERRLQHQRARERNALALTAGKFVRIAVTRLRVEPNIGQRGNNTRFALGC